MDNKNVPVLFGRQKLKEHVAYKEIEYCLCLSVDKILSTEDSHFEYEKEILPNGVEKIVGTKQICNICGKERGQAALIEV